MSHSQNLRSQRLQPHMPRALWWGALLLGLFVWGSFASEADARPRILRPGTQPAVFQGGIGGAIGISRAGGDFVLNHTLGYHFSGDSSGFALGGDLDLYLTGGFGLAIGPRFWWDIPIAGMAIYIAPYIRPALVLGFGGGVTPAINLQFGVQGKVILFNRLLLFIELPGIAINLYPTSIGLVVAAHVQMLLGAGVTF